MPSFDSNNPQEFGWGAPGQVGTIVPFSYRGHPFYNGVHRDAVVYFTAICDRLMQVTPGGMYQAHATPSPDDGFWGYELRQSRNSSSMSFHSWGLAIDFNAVQNPNKLPTRQGDRFVIPSSFAGIMRSEFGGLYGGEWTDKMHQECHLSPAELKAWTARHLAAGGKPAAPHPTVPVATRGHTPFPLPGPTYYFGPFSGPNESISGQGKNDAPFRPFLAMAQKKLGVAADGEYGPVTEAAIRRFQGIRHMPVDGLIGPKTWAALIP